MNSTRIADLLQPFLDRELTALQLEQVSTYIDLLLRWNARINLTAIRNPEEIVTRHFGESFFMARHLFPSPQPMQTTARQGHAGSAQRSPRADNIRVIDLGSGAGFPALPLKIWDPQLHLTLIESNNKKATFLREVARTLAFTNVDVISSRAEVLAADPDFPRADVVTFRAVEKFDQILLVASSLLSPHGRLALLLGATQLPKLQSLPFLTWQTSSVPQSQSRLLSIGKR